MATSGTASYTPTLAEIFEDAYARAGSEMRSGWDFRTARFSMNMLTAEWANRGINLWTIESGSIPLLDGVATYDLPNDTIDLVEHVVRQNDGNVSTQVDINISRISVSTYSTIPNKITKGRPIQVYINRQSGATTPYGIQNPTISVWPTPMGDSYTFVYWRLRRMQDPGNGGGTADIPFRFVAALTAGLAYYVAMKIPGAMDRVPMLQAEYERQWQLASEEDRDRAPVRFVPRNMFYR